VAEIDRGGGIAIGADVIGTIALSYDGCNGFCYLIMVIVMVMVVRVVVMITVAVPDTDTDTNIKGNRINVKGEEGRQETEANSEAKAEAP